METSFDHLFFLSIIHMWSWFSFQLYIVFICICHRNWPCKMGFASVWKQTEGGPKEAATFKLRSSTNRYLVPVTISTMSISTIYLCYYACLISFFVLPNHVMTLCLALSCFKGLISLYVNFMPKLSIVCIKDFQLITWRFMF